VAHEINNPLAAVIANLEFLDHSLGEEPTPELRAELGEALRDAREAADRVRRIVVDLRRFARVDEKPTTTVLDLPLVLDASLRMTERLFQTGEPVQVAYGTTPYVDADEGRLTQVFVNLLANAAHAVGGGTRGVVRVATRTDDAGRAVVVVSDTGCGIEPKVLGRIFDPFFTTKAVGEGTGLGLSISHGVIAALGGSITVESEVGRGTVFEVALPPAAGKPVEAEPSPSPGLDQRRLRVLVVDDETTVVKSLERLLRDHEVVGVTRAADALEILARDSAFDVILCDVFMPVMNGLGFYRAVHSGNASAAKRIVFITGGAFSPKVMEEVAELGVPTLEKPFDRAAVVALVEDVATLRSS